MLSLGFGCPRWVLDAPVAFGFPCCVWAPRWVLDAPLGFWAPPVRFGCPPWVLDAPVAFQRPIGFWTSHLGFRPPVGFWMSLLGFGLPHRVLSSPLGFGFRIGFRFWGWVVRGQLEVRGACVGRYWLLPPASCPEAVPAGGFGAITPLKAVAGAAVEPADHSRRSAASSQQGRQLTVLGVPRQRLPEAEPACGRHRGVVSALPCRDARCHPRGHAALPAVAPSQPVPGAGCSRRSTGA